MKTIQQNDTEVIEAHFLDKDNISLTAVTPLLSIRRQSDNRYFDGSNFLSVFNTVRMVEIDNVNQPGQYLFTFNTQGFNDDVYSFTVNVTGAINIPQSGELTVGGFIDNIDSSIASIDKASVITLDGVFTKREKERLFSELTKQFEDVLQRLSIIATDLEHQTTRIQRVEAKQEHLDNLMELNIDLHRLQEEVSSI